MKKKELKKRNNILHMASIKSPYSITLDLKDEDKVEINEVYLFDKPGITNKINIKAVIRDRASFVYKGLIKITKDAQNINTYLSVKCLLLGNTSKAFALPSLEILNPEVKAGHGVSISNLDDVQMSYLKSRGISNQSAQEILVNAFLNS